MYLQMLSCFFIVYKTSSVISFGCEVEKRTRRSGLINATISRRLAKLTTPFKSPPGGETLICKLLIAVSNSRRSALKVSPSGGDLEGAGRFHLYESTFWPSNVISR